MEQQLLKFCTAAYVKHTRAATEQQLLTSHNQLLAKHRSRCSQAPQTTSGNANIIYWAAEQKAAETEHQQLLTANKNSCFNVTQTDGSSITTHTLVLAGMKRKQLMTRSEGSR
jgi:urease accessory protein UreH